ncbi:MAG: DUF5337 domain-containing protein [Rhodobacterales bacterium]|nr:DUF5337 domain-containing protein [Rhodobacterales bacterium]
MTRTPPDPDARHLALQARLAAIVMALAMVLWMGAQWLGGRLGWDVRYVFLFDLAAIAAFVWAMAVTWRIWQRQRGRRGNP